MAAVPRLVLAGGPHTGQSRRQGDAALVSRLLLDETTVNGVFSKHLRSLGS